MTLIVLFLFLLVFFAIGVFIFVDTSKLGLPPLVAKSRALSQVFLKSPSSIYCRARFMSAAEFNYFLALESYLPPRARITCKVRLADLVQPLSPPRTSAWQTAFNRVACKHVDFVLLDEYLNPLCIIELDDSSHARYSRQLRDTFVDSVLADVGYPVYHVPVRAAYPPAEFFFLDKHFKKT